MFCMCSDFLEWVWIVCMVVVKWIPQDMQLAMIVIYFNFNILLVKSAHNKYSEITIIACDAKLTLKNHIMSYLLKSLYLAGVESSVYLCLWIWYYKNCLRQYMFSSFTKCKHCTPFKLRIRCATEVQSPFIGDTAYCVCVLCNWMQWQISLIITILWIMKHVCWSR